MTDTNELEIKANLKEFISRNSLEDVEKIGADTDLFQEGFLDSYGYIELVKHLESSFKIRFSDDELVSGSLNTFRNIESIVNNKRAEN
jgi:D-alanine--poly(phosphoribitol) ligase subunit 2